MKEIKFRAYNKRRKEIEYFDDLYWFEENFVNENGDSDFIILQYTGLKDKNGKEIYEGDIVKRYSPSSAYNINQLCEVKFAYGCFAFVPLGDAFDKIMSNYIYGYIIFYDCTLEIIGNIYENPELVEI